MEIRKVEIDFSDAAVRWNPEHPEWCHIWNAMSSAVPALEQFLVKVVRQMRDQLPGSAPESLRRDVQDFIIQEGRHTKLHMKFNKKLEEEGYDFVAAEKKLRADYARFLDEKGLKFSMVYCEGFETFGPIISTLFFDRSADLMKNVHEPSCHLWLWHIAEEYEHRTVCNYLYKEVYGSYWYRIYGLWFAAVHLFKYALGQGWKMAQHDLRTGAIKGRVRSNLRFAHAVYRIGKGVLPDMLRNAHRPSYDPARLPAPQNVMDLLAETSKKYGVVEAA